MTKIASVPGVAEFAEEVRDRIDRLTTMAAAGGLESAVDLMTTAMTSNGVIHAFGTGHSEAFAMEIAGRAGGLIPTNKIALRDLALRGSRSSSDLGATLERDESVVQELWDLSPFQPGDVLMIASNSGVNGSIVGFALLAKQHDIPLIAVTSMAHTMAVPTKHPSGQRLCDVADIVIDNLAPYGDATLELNGGVPVGAVSSITAAYIAQLLTIGVSERIAAMGQRPPLYLSANIPGSDTHNGDLEQQYEGRIRRGT